MYHLASFQKFWSCSPLLVPIEIYKGHIGIYFLIRFQKQLTEVRIYEY